MGSVSWPEETEVSVHERMAFDHRLGSGHGHGHDKPPQRSDSQTSEVGGRKLWDAWPPQQSISSRLNEVQSRAVKVSRALNWHRSR